MATKKKASKKKKRRERRANRRARIQLVKSYVEDWKDANPQGTMEECERAVTAQLREDFGDNIWQTILKAILKAILEVLF
jgi:hypothetical protein